MPIWITEFLAKHPKLLELGAALIAVCALAAYIHHLRAEITSLDHELVTAQVKYQSAQAQIAEQNAAVDRLKVASSEAVKWGNTTAKALAEGW